MTLFSTVLTQLVLVVSQRSVQRGEFSQLVSLVIVLTLRGRGGLQNVSIGTSAGDYRHHTQLDRLTVSITVLISLTHLSTFSCVSPMTRQCNSSCSSLAN